MRQFRILALAALLAGCCGCPPGGNATAQSAGTAADAQSADDRPTGPMFDLKPGVWEEFKTYRAKLTPGKDEYFATATDGAWAWEDTEQKALALCDEHSTGPKCILFAKNAKVLVPYRLN